MKIFFPDLFVDCIYDINVNILKKKGIKGLIIDIDNTLAAHNKEEADERLIAWIEKVKEQGINICLVSNNTQNRVMAFNKKLNLYTIHRANKPRSKPLLRQ